MAKLKVFRTPIGFHDAYVAVPSQKAALAAWGAEADLFARGLAETVTDAELAREPLSKPGQVIRVRRGTDAEHFRALPTAARRPSPPKVGAERSPEKAEARERKTTKPAKTSRPRPSRAPVEQADAAIADAEAKYRKALKILEKQEQALRQERKRLTSDHEANVQRLSGARDDALRNYHKRIEAWANEE